MHFIPNWEFVADTVMGGISTGSVTDGPFEGRPASVLRGEVSHENNGGFVQMAFDPRLNHRDLDVSEWAGLEITAWGNDHAYDIRLRTAQLTRPWQSFRYEAMLSPSSQTLKIPFAEFMPHNTDAKFDPSCMRRIGVVAIGSEFTALAAVSRIGLYREKSGRM